MILYDYTCPNCGFEQENLVNSTDKDDVLCEQCSERMLRQTPATHDLVSIIPTYPGSKRRKAGYQHKFVNRPATKTQVGYGGGISQGEPK